MISEQHSLKVVEKVSIVMEYPYYKVKASPGPETGEQTGQRQADRQAE